MLIILEKSSKNQLIHTLLYHTIYRCIMIQKQQYIDTPKLCIITFLVGVSVIYVRVCVNICFCNAMCKVSIIEYVFYVILRDLRGK